MNNLKTTPWYIHLWSVPLFHPPSSGGWSDSSPPQERFLLQQSQNTICRVYTLCPSSSKVEKHLVSGGVCHQMIPCSTSVTFSNNPQISLVSSSNFCPSWLRTRQGLSWMSSRLWAVQGKPMLINRWDPLWSEGPRIPQAWKPSTCSWNAIPQKFKASFYAPLVYLFLAMSHGVTPLRWQKEMTQKLESKVTANSHSWSHSKQVWHTNSCF